MKSCFHKVSAGKSSFTKVSERKPSFTKVSEQSSKPSFTKVSAGKPSFTKVSERKQKTLHPSTSSGGGFSYLEKTIIVFVCGFCSADRFCGHCPQGFPYGSWHNGNLMYLMPGLLPGNDGHQV